MKIAIRHTNSICRHEELSSDVFSGNKNIKMTAKVFTHIFNTDRQKSPTDSGSGRSQDKFQELI